TLDPAGNPVDAQDVRESLYGALSGQDIVDAARVTGWSGSNSSTDALFVELEAQLRCNGCRPDLSSTVGLRAFFEVASFVPVAGDVIDIGFCGFDGASAVFGGGSWLDAGLSCGALVVPGVTRGMVSGGEVAVRFGDDVIDAARGVDRVEDTVDAGRRVDGGSPVVCGLNSFSADTEVLLASGDRVAIEDVVVGDVVWATNPESGVSTGRAVTAVWPHEDWLIELDTSHGVVVTTEDHHFWNATDQAWQETREFDAGDRLVTTDGVTVTVYGLDEQTWRYGDAFDLTVDDLHTYYVTTSDDVPVLVHNTNGESCGGSLNLSSLLQARAAELNSQRSWWNSSRGTTSVAQVRNTDTGYTFQIVTTNGDRLDEDLLTGLRADEVLVAGPGHAERTLFDYVSAQRAAGVNLEITAGGTSRGICLPCAAAGRQHGLTIGGPYYRGFRPPNGPYREFWGPSVG
ncbi:MAG: polymorphic toxin-type HINT domain-containing protein, partial [Actinomycetota bacterium]